MAGPQSRPSVQRQFMRSMNLKFANTLESYMVESATARSTLPPKRCTLESSRAIRPPLQIIRAEPDIDFFAPTLSKVIRSRVLLLAPHHLPSVVRSRVLVPLRPPLTPSPRSPRSPSRHSHPLATLQPWPELNRMPRNLLVVVQPLPAGLVPYQSNPRHPHLAQSETISALIIQETTT